MVDVEISKRKERLRRLFDLIVQNPGWTLAKLMGEFCWQIGVREELFEKYMKVLNHRGMVVVFYEPGIGELVYEKGVFESMKVREMGQEKLLGV